MNESYRRRDTVITHTLHGSYLLMKRMKSCLYLSYNNYSHQARSVVCCVHWHKY
jgi:hypothetical protein